MGKIVNNYYSCIGVDCRETYINVVVIGEGMGTNVGQTRKKLQTSFMDIHPLYAGPFAEPDVLLFRKNIILIDTFYQF